MMNESWNDELISAYLDGELTADEQALVEQALATDARLRQMHDDLRALRQSLQTMPRLRLGDDFAQRVLLQAERAQQAELRAAVSEPAPTNPPAVIPHAHDPTHTIAVVPAHPTEPTTWHVMVWGVAGLAAAILCVLLLPQQMSNVAWVGSGDSPKTTLAPANSAPEEKTEARVIDDLDGVTLEMRDARRQTDQQAFSAPAAPPPVQDKPYAAGEQQMLKAAPANRVSESAVQQKENTLAPPAPAMLRKKAGPDREAESLNGTQRFAAPRAMKAADALSVESLQRAAGDQDEVTKRLKDVASAADTQRLVVVRLDVPVSALRERRVDAALANHQIAFADGTNERQLAAKKQEQKRSSALAEARTFGAEPGGKTADLKGDNLAAADGESAKAARDDVDVIYVEADLEQVAQTLRELAELPGFQLTLADHEQVEAVRRRYANSNAAAQGGGRPQPAEPAAVELQAGTVEKVPAAKIAEAKPAATANLPDGAPVAGNLSEANSADNKRGAVASGAAGGGGGLGAGLTDSKLRVDTDRVSDKAKQAEAESGVARRVLLPTFEKELDSWRQEGLSKQAAGAAATSPREGGVAADAVPTPAVIASAVNEPLVESKSAGKVRVLFVIQAVPQAATEVDEAKPAQPEK
ncbi:MAG TPA: zf-HC2 domain-containing protein [Pirellulaceae bacterium]|nr:zf-HC2 domain-containing protein [Pirellulaceae bacterium]